MIERRARVEYGPRFDDTSGPHIRIRSNPYGPLSNGGSFCPGERFDDILGNFSPNVIGANSESSRGFSQIYRFQGREDTAEEPRGSHTAEGV
jgi:hypothetical protein